MWICLLVLILIGIGMHSVKSETKCITTIDTVNSRLAHTSAIRTSAKFPFYCRLLLSNKDTNLRIRWELHPSVEAILGLGLEFLWEINVQFKVKYPSYACVFIEYSNRLIARWRHFTHYQNNPDYIKRSTDWAKSRPDGGVYYMNQVCKSCQMSIVYLRVLKVRNPTNRL